MRIVTGSGRSGTSLVAQLLAAAGGDFGPPERLQPADSHNPRGYLEDQEVMELNIRLLLGLLADPATMLGTRPAGTGRRLLDSALKMQYTMPVRRRTLLARARRWRAEMEQIAMSREGLIVKDPRFSSSLRAWREIADIPCVLYCLRHPCEVAESTARSYGVPRWVGYRMWQVRVREFLRQSVDLPVVMVNYNVLLDPETAPRELIRLLRFLDVDPSVVDADALLERGIDPRLRRFTVENDPLRRSVRALWEELKARHERHAEPAPLEPGPAR